MVPFLSQLSPCRIHISWCFLPGVQSALYGLVLSLVICVAAVAVFTTHILLLLPVLLSILGKTPIPMCQAFIFPVNGGLWHYWLSGDLN